MKGGNMMNKHQAYMMCQNYLNQYVKVKATNGETYRGYVGKVNSDTVYLAIPDQDIRESNSSRGCCRPGYPIPPAYYPPYYRPIPYASAPYPYYRRRGWRWVAIPLAFLAGVAVGTIID
jgi:hypothetical protein